MSQTASSNEEKFASFTDYCPPLGYSILMTDTKPTGKVIKSEHKICPYDSSLNSKVHMRQSCTCRTGKHKAQLKKNKKKNIVTNQFEYKEIV